MLFHVGVACAVLIAIGTAEAAYLGKEIGPLSQLHHAVRGRVFAVDSRTLFLHDFHYDGEGPAAYFYVGTSKTPNAAGALRLRDERGGAGPLRRYRGESVTLSLPEGKTLRDVAWFSVWCDEYSINFGSVEIPRSLEFPKPAKVGALRGVHGVASDPIVVVDAQTLLVPNFSYDGEAPDAKFWVGRGDKPSPQGIRIPDENGKEAPLRKYDRKTIVLTLPGELTVFDIGHFAVWCEAFTVNFGHVPLPRAALANVPPSLKMLGVSPQSRNNALAGEAAQAFREPSRPRKPLVRLDATTYRPHLRPGPPATQDQPAAHAQHRRADAYTPSPQQLLTDPEQQFKQERQSYDRPQSGNPSQTDPNQQQQQEIERQPYNIQIQGRFQVQNEPNHQQNNQNVETQANSQSIPGNIESHQNQQLEQQRYADNQETERENYSQRDQGSVQSQNEQNQNLEQQRLIIQEQANQHASNHQDQGSVESKQNQQSQQERYVNQQDVERQNYNQQDKGRIQSQNEENQNLEQQRLVNQQVVNQHANNHEIQGTQQQNVGAYDQNQLIEEQLNYINQHIQAHIQLNPKSYLNELLNQQNVYQPQNLLNQNQYLQNGQVLSTQDLLYRQQLYEQQRRALELQLQQYRQQTQQYQAAPSQYRLLPYNYEQTSDSRRNYRQVDLDLVGNSGSN